MKKNIFILLLFFVSLTYSQQTLKVEYKQIYNTASPISRSAILEINESNSIYVSLMQTTKMLKSEQEILNEKESKSNDNSTHLMVNIGSNNDDFYLYDWRVKDISHKWHAFTHPKKALEKALSIFDLNDMEKDIIINHMWPVTVKLPRTKEAFILTLVDKYCATYETVSYTVKQLKKKPSWQYAYLMLWLVIRK